MSIEKERRFKWPIRGQFLFAVVFVVVAVLLLSLIGDQTRWVNRGKFFSQPRLWPAIAIGGMVLFGALHLWKLPRRRFVRADVVEWRLWFLAIEWVLWFLTYVIIVPWAGYLPTTLVFVPLLMWRMGYRSRRMLGVGVVFAVMVVVVFKTFLEVKIPGGAVYEILPGALRSFFILNF